MKTDSRVVLICHTCEYRTKKPCRVTVDPERSLSAGWQFLVNHARCLP